MCGSGCDLRGAPDYTSKLLTVHVQCLLPASSGVLSIYYCQLSVD
jgi:hypothetical protein